MTGFLRMRQSSREWRMKTWYCVLYKAHLYWYASKKDAQVAKRLQGRVNVVGAGVSTGHGRFHVYPNAFIFMARNGQVYFCSAPTDTEQQQWIQEMNTLAHQQLQQTSESPAKASAQNRTFSSSSTVSSATSGSNSSVVFLGCGKDGNKPQSFRRRSSGFGGRLELHEKKSLKNELTCCMCDMEFSALRKRRYVCGSCGLSFCRWHCSKDAILSGPNGTRSARVCDSCSYRQCFITFAVALTSTKVQEMKFPKARLICRHDCFDRENATTNGDADDVSTPRCHRQQWKELELIVSKPANLTALHLMCLMKKYLNMPWLFVRTLCLFIPIFEADSESDLAEYWVQFIGMYVPLIQSVYPDLACPTAAASDLALPTEHNQANSDEQQCSLHLYIDVVIAICRRSPFFALRTVWECLALYEDARLKGDVVCANYILLLIYAVSSFNGNSELVAYTWLDDAPEPQADAMVCAMDDLRCVVDLMSSTAPCTLVSQWIHAKRATDIAMWRQCVLNVVDSSNLSAQKLLSIFSPVPAEGERFYRAIVDAVLETASEGCGDHKTPQPEREQNDNQEQIFNDEANFVYNLTAIADQLRLVTPVASRKQALPGLLQQLQDSLTCGVSSSQVYLPLYGASSSCATQILRVVTGEGKVFSTRCRAPTMIVFEGISPESQQVTESAEQQEDEEDARTPFIKQSSANSKRAELRKLGRKESQMLDQLLCSHDAASIASIVKDGDSPSASSSSSDSFEEELLPDEFSLDEARLIYEESTSASMSEATHGNEEAFGGCGGGESCKNTETWMEKTQRIKASSEFGDLPGWTLVSVIAKSFDDLRQEVFALQLMATLHQIFQGNELSDLYLRPYR